MFTQTFILACIASIATADEHSQNKIAEAMSNLAQTRQSQVQTLGLAQILAKSTTSIGTTDDGSQHMEIHSGENMIRPPPALSQVMLAQTEKSSGHTCHSSQDRNKAPLDDFFSIYNGSSMYTDADFAPDNDAIFWADMGEGEDKSHWIEKTTWTRASSAFPNNTLFGADGVHPDDIDQGSLGNCWFLAACAAVAQVPGTVEKMFLNSPNEISANGIYAVNFYSLGMPHTVIVDDYLPLRENGNTFFAGLGKNDSREDEGSLWVPIIEKAFAKYHGNYLHIGGGNKQVAIRTMINTPTVSEKHRKEGGISQDDLWTKLTSHVDQGDMLTTGTGGGDDTTTNEFGLVNGHAYNVMGYTVLSDGTKLIKMQNPWGKDSYNGDWSDSSPLWDSVEGAREDAGFVDRKDGVFFMAFNDYWEQTGSTGFTFDVQDWHQASFLMLDDQTADADGKAEHHLTLTSEVDQMIYLTAHTWHNRCIADMCQGGTFRHSIYTEPTKSKSFKSGSKQIELYLEANFPLDVRTKWDWSDENRANDWSVIAFGADGPVTLTHVDGFESDVLPVINGIHDSDGDSDDNNDDDDSGDVDTPFALFQNWVEAYEVDNLPDYDCGFVVAEEYVTGSDGEEFYRTIMKNTCDENNLQVTVYMDEEEWNNLQHFYSRSDEEGNLVKDSIIRGKPKFDDDGYMGLKFKVGTLSRPGRNGVTDAFQGAAGWENQPGDWGIRYYTTSWNDI